MGNNQPIIRKKQQGLGGLLLSAVITGATLLAVAGVVTKANRESYQTPNKVRIEVANQLVQSGLRHWGSLISSKNKLQELLSEYSNNDRVVLGCSEDKDLPESLSPQETIDTLATPNSTEVVHLKGIFVPYDCNKPIGIDNYRLTFEIHGQTHCNASIKRNMENCIVRTIAMNAYAGEEYNPKINSTDTKTQTKKNNSSNNSGRKPGKSSTSNKKNTNASKKNNDQKDQDEETINSKGDETAALNTRRGRNVQ